MMQTRTGKTQRDHKSGAWARCIANKRARADWQNANKNSRGPFPYKTCNGKRNKHR